MTIGDAKATAVFLDTNVLVRAVAVRAPQHLEARRAVRALHHSETSVWISRQVLREYLAVLSRPQSFSDPVPRDQLVADVRTFLERYRVAEDGPRVTEQLHSLLGSVPSGGRQVHDANIVATMLTHGIPRLLTANRSDFVRFTHAIELLDLETFS